MEEVWETKQYRALFNRILESLVNDAAGNVLHHGHLNMFSDLPKGVQGESWVDYPPLDILPTMIRRGLSWLDSQTINVPLINTYSFIFFIRKTGGLGRGTVLLDFHQYERYSPEPLMRIIEGITKESGLFKAVLRIPLYTTGPDFFKAVDDQEAMTTIENWLSIQTTSEPHLIQYNYNFKVIEATELTHRTLVFTIER